MGHNFNDIAKDAEQGDSDAQFNLGLCYFNGDGVEKDLEQAVNWFRKGGASSWKRIPKSKSAGS